MALAELKQICTGVRLDASAHPYIVLVNGKAMARFSKAEAAVATAVEEYDQENTVEVASPYGTMGRDTIRERYRDMKCPWLPPGQRFRGGTW